MRPTLVIGERYRSRLGHPLSHFGFEVLWLPDSPFLNPFLSGHADLSLFYPGNGEIFLSGNLIASELADHLQCLGLKVHYISVRQGSQYPKDVLLNVRLLEDKSVIMNRKTAALEITEYLERNQDYRIIPVRQGYSACAALGCRNAVITADNGIYQSVLKKGISVLKIKQGGVELPGYQFGFIGGAGFCYNGKVFFSADLKTHPDAGKITQFLNNNDLEPVSLSKGPLFDFGGAIILQ